MRSSLRRLLGVVTASSAVAGGLVAFAPTSFAATDFCSAPTVPVYRTINPTRGGNSLLTRWSGEITSAVKHGFTDNRGVFGAAARTATSGVAPVTRMYNPKTVDFVWMASPTDVANAKAVGYQVQQVDFYAPTTASACTVAVHRFRKDSHRRNAWDPTERATLIAQGWTDSGASFYLKKTTGSPVALPPAPAPAPAPTATATATATPTAAPTPTPTVPAPAGTDNTFGIAVIPDTQAETNNTANTPFLNRVNWMVANKTKLDLRYVLHTGDMTNWGWLDSGQLTRAKAAMDVLKKNGLPYALTVGNHDTRAVGWDGVAGSSKYGGAAYMNNPECVIKLGDAACKSWLLARQTTNFNQTFPLSGMGNVGGAFEAGKDDNIWTSFTANNTKWLVLTMELWPRAEAVAWAKNVVATHPSYNVIIQTHHYLNGDATISSSNGGYGSNSPKYIYNEIVSKYANVKLVFSGHTGGFTSRSDAPNGNTVVSYLGNDMGGPTYNPVRTLSINTATGQVTSTVYDPIHSKTVNTTSNTITIIK
jgi:hypothetical protein